MSCEQQLAWRSVPSTLHLQHPIATLPLLKLEHPILCLWSVAAPSGSSKTPTASNQLHTPLSFLFHKDRLYTSVFPHPCFFHRLHGLEGTPLAELKSCTQGTAPFDSPEFSLSQLPFFLVTASTALLPRLFIMHPFGSCSFFFFSLHY